MKKAILKYFGVQTEPIVGIDIGSSSVKVMQLECSRNKTVVQNYATAYLPYGSVVAKEIKYPDKVVKALKKAIQDAKITTNLACIAIPSIETISRVIQVDKDLEEKEIMLEVEQAASKCVPYDLTDVDIDFYVLGRSESPVCKDVLFVASKTENVLNRVDILKQVGLTAKIVDVDTYANHRAFLLLIRQILNKGKVSTVGLLEIGANVTTLYVFKDFIPIYNKTHNFGDSKLIESIATEYDMTLEQARIAKNHNDLPKNYKEQILKPFKENISEQIFKTCEWFYSSGDHKKIEHLFLSGGGSSIDGLIELVQERLKVKTVTVNPVMDMKVARGVDQQKLTSQAASLLTCCGLALRNVM